MSLPLSRIVIVLCFFLFVILVALYSSFITFLSTCSAYDRSGTPLCGNQVIPDSLVGEFFDQCTSSYNGVQSAVSNVLRNGYSALQMVSQVGSVCCFLFIFMKFFNTECDGCAIHPFLC